MTPPQEHTGPPSGPRPEDEGTTTAIASCGSRMEASLKVSALSSAGFGATLGSDDAGGLHPEMGALYCGAYRVLVPSGQADEAVALLASIDAGDHALPEGLDPSDPTAPRTADVATATINLDGRRRGWVLVAITMIALFLAYRLVASAIEFGIF